MENNELNTTVETKAEVKPNKKFDRRDNRKRVKEVSDIESKTIAINRVTKVVKGGRKMKFAAHVIVGDRKGRVGYGSGKAAETPAAIDKALKRAKANMITVSISENTIPHEVTGKFGTSKVFMMPAKTGNGIIAGSSVRPIVELAGIKDITTKAYGSRNAINCAKATFDALKKLRTAEEIMAIRNAGKEENK